MRPAHAFLAASIMLFWGFNFVVAKVAVVEFPPMFVIALRFALVAAVMVAFVPPPWAQMKQVLAVSCTLGWLHFGLMFTGIQNLDAGTAALAVQLQVPFVTLLAAVVFGDSFGWRRALGMAIAFAGVVLVAGAPRVSGNLGSLALVIAGALVWATANIQIKAIGPINGFALNAWVSLLATPQLLIASWLMESGQWESLSTASWAGWGAIVYMAVVTTIAGYGAWYYLLGQYRMNQTMPFTLLVPVFGVMAGILFLDEPLTWQIMVGGALTVAGVGVIVVRRPRLIEPVAEASSQ